MRPLTCLVIAVAGCSGLGGKIGTSDAIDQQLAGIAGDVAAVKESVETSAQAGRDVTIGDSRSLQILIWMVGANMLLSAVKPIIFEWRQRRRNGTAA